MTSESHMGVLYYKDTILYDGVIGVKGGVIDVSKGMTGILYVSKLTSFIYG